MESLLGKTLAELQEVAQRVGLPKFAGKQLAEWLYVRHAMTFDEMTNISLKGREALKQHYTTGRHAPVAEAVSQDGTRKYLFHIPSLSREGEGGSYIESVYIPDADRATLCVSTQAGCKMGCKFCMTGTLGFHGHLPAAEILNQILYFPDLTNVVYMGEGEPMDNLDNVLRSLQVLTADWGCAWSPKRITVSSVGHPNLQRFLNESDCHLAISLHNPFAAERREIMPAEKMYSLSQVIALLKQYDWTHQRRISFEYICWHGQNDTIRHANELLRLLRNLPCRINLIRFHKTNSPAPQAGRGQGAGQNGGAVSRPHPASTPCASRPGAQVLACRFIGASPPAEMSACAATGDAGVSPAGSPQATHSGVLSADSLEQTACMSNTNSPSLCREGWGGSSSDEKQMEWLRDYLSDHGITTTIRRSRGEDILAACGMLVNALRQQETTATD